MAQKFSELKYDCLAIGSLPHTDLEKAMRVVEDNFKIPFWPQLVKLKKNEDMILQFLENMPSFFCENEKVYLEVESEKFFCDLEQFFLDYDEIDENANSELLEKYAINSSIAFPKFIEIIGKNYPVFAKGQIVGPFTLSTTLTDKSGKPVFYDETLKDIIVKTLVLKALWQIKRIKFASPSTVPIIFIDEPSISQIGTSAYLNVSPDEVSGMLKLISDAIQKNGGLSAIHCCGKCDWEIPIKSGVDIINLDAFNFAKNLSTFSEVINKFLLDGGKIAWGVVPTLDEKALKNLDVNKLSDVFENAVKYLTKKGINEKIIRENSIFTPSCGAGALSEELACLAMRLVRELSERYHDI